MNLVLHAATENIEIITEYLGGIKLFLIILKNIKVVFSVPNSKKF